MGLRSPPLLRRVPSALHAAMVNGAAARTVASAKKIVEGRVAEAQAQKEQAETRLYQALAAETAAVAAKAAVVPKSLQDLSGEDQTLDDLLAEAAAAGRRRRQSQP